MKPPPADYENPTAIDRAELLEFGRVIRHKRELLKLTLDQLSAAAGISKPYLSNIETGSAPGLPSPAKLSAIETSLQLPPGQLAKQADWLRTPRSIRQLIAPAGNATATMAAQAARHDTMKTQVPRRSDGAINLDALLYAATEPNLTRQTTTEQPVAMQRVPLINRVPAGNPAEFTDLDYPAGIADGDVPAPASTDEPGPGAVGATNKPANDMFALRIQGDSMEPHYHHGDIIVLSATQTPKNGDDCLVRFDEMRNFSTTFKRIYFEPAESQQTPTHVRLEPLNPKHRNRLIDLQHVSGIFPAIWKITPAASQLSATHTSGEEASPAPAPSGSPAKSARRRTRKPANTPPSRQPVAAQVESPTSPAIEPKRAAIFPIELD
ncbi:MAG: helix-turn-helix domain-containing protein [Phycisphaerales bacterium]|nr:helix-turn-helix domain-containing protein [Phycisphaerales bacterium]